MDKYFYEAGRALEGPSEQETDWSWLEDQLNSSEVNGDEQRASWFAGRLSHRGEFTVDENGMMLSYDLL